jgi:hypothetical protein
MNKGGIGNCGLCGEYDCPGHTRQGFQGSRVRIPLWKILYQGKVLCEVGAHSKEEALGYAIRYAVTCSGLTPDKLDVQPLKEIQS